MLERYKTILSPYRGIYRRGVKEFHQSRLFVNKLFSYYFDFKNGVDFTRNAYPKELNLNPKRVFEYEPSGFGFLKKILQDLDITPSDKIIDVGCGKGSAMKVMIGFPFSKVDGIEISDVLCAIAERNFKKLKAPNTRIFNIDASRFTMFDDYNYIYFFNPFPEEVMEDVMQNLLESLSRLPRKVTIIYDNPTCFQTIENTGVFKKLEKEYLDILKYKVYLYTNQSL